MSTYDIRDPRFKALIIGHAKLEKLFTGCRWAEGPVYVPAAKSLLWSDIPNDRLMRFDETDGSVSVFESPCGYHNGHTRDALGRVIACEHGGRRISRLEHDGSWVGLIDRFEGKRFNSPNDAVVKSDGTIWFSDPTYGIDSAYEGHAAPSEIGASNVYRFDPASGAVAAVVTDMVKPNGLAFSPDERLLYVADTGATHVPDLPAVIRVYDVAAGGSTVGNGRVFATSPAGFFDGFRVDRGGNIWTSTGDAVAIYAPDGTLIGRIPVPEIVSNLTFGGPKRNRLYVTAQTSLYSIFVNAHGIT
ncbi:gluconolactonase [Bradyrhizobium sp. SSBR45G]|uniref:SMP-30/gluconolactonase/LRE family protein n=1 Tax=unclassified Bradyrhizobium TaxID=2631580 RepID=UPI002342BB55|nr:MULTISPECIES: SMP-30/gluconolactonase/LRE family protein [unclassified Bradyrhizobium]GLH78619.1 gluconolactonase [Bradyrhizobium sp. SSBR45G]GLH89739.1 gluconolactonase [Bradyrhizobium sp. SSBR45R]